MDLKDFENKLSQVAYWERKEIKPSEAQSGRKPYGEPIGEKPTEIVLKKLRFEPCPVSGRNEKCHWHLKHYLYGKTKLWVERCTTCGLTLTPEGNSLILPIIDGNLALKVILHDRECANNK